jgi:hypothetical protein
LVFWKKMDTICSRTVLFQKKVLQLSLKSPCAPTKQIKNVNTGSRENSFFDE